jgi:hypothetical protein
MTAWWWAISLGAVAVPWGGEVEWLDVTPTPECFFFAGPLDLGRDEPLGVRAERRGAALALGGFVFEPTSGGYERTSTHDFGGPWEVTQRLKGRWRGDVFQGTYTYEEQAVGEPVGACRIDAVVRVRLPERR